MAGLQAQEPRHPFIGLWTRLEGLTVDAVRGALERRELVRGTTLRGTLHLHTAEDFAAWRPLLQPMLTESMQLLGDRAEGLDVGATLAQARGALDEEPRTFAQLRDLLVAAFPDVNDRALGFAVRMCLPLVMVPTDDRWAFPSVASFTPADAWLGSTWTAAAGTRRELVRRYLAAFGPAGETDLQAWSGVRSLREDLRAMRDELEVLRLDGTRRDLFDLPGAPRPGADADAPVRLLPEFDNLLLSHADRTRVIADEHRGAVYTKNLRVRSTFLVDGVVAGTWTLERKRGVATIALVPLGRLAARDRRALEAEAEALARFAEPDAKGHAVRVDA